MDRSQRPPFWKSVLVILASMFLWLLVFLQQASYQLALNPITGSSAIGYHQSSPP